MEDLRDEYLEISKKETRHLFIGVTLSSMVFVVPFVIIILKGWWQPLGSSTDGWRWAITSAVLLGLIYLAMLFDKKYRQH